jgi:hypothetical protein
MEMLRIEDGYAYFVEEWGRSHDADRFCSLPTTKFPRESSERFWASLKFFFRLSDVYAQDRYRKDVSGSVQSLTSGACYVRERAH